MELDDLSWVREGLKKPGKTQTGLANALRRAPSMITALLQGKRDLKAREIRIISEYLGVEGPASEPDDVEIVGLAGAGPEGGIEFASSQGQLGRAPVPPGWTESTVAVEVRGTSMRGLADDGWLVYYDDEKRGSLADMHIGLPCIVWLPDGRVLIKTPYLGRGSGLFDLESQNPAVPTMRGVPVESAALVTAIVPRPPTRRATSARSDTVAA